MQCNNLSCFLQTQCRQCVTNWSLCSDQQYHICEAKNGIFPRANRNSEAIMEGPYQERHAGAGTKNIFQVVNSILFYFDLIWLICFSLLLTKELSPYISTVCPLQHPRAVHLRSCRTNHRSIATAGTDGFSTRKVDQVTSAKKPKLCRPHSSLRLQYCMASRPYLHNTAVATSTWSAWSWSWLAIAALLLLPCYR